MPGTETQNATQSRFDFENYLGVDDHNFAEFPFFSATPTEDRLRETLTTEHISDNKLVPGTKITRTQKIIASEEYGLPGMRDGDVLLALMSLLSQSTALSGNQPTRIYFCRRELLTFMKWKDNGESYEDLLEALHRWTATSYHYWNWWNDDIGAYGEIAFPVLTKFAGRNTAFLGVEDETHYYVDISPDFIAAFLGGGWSKTLDLNIYYSLRSPTAKLLYRFLDKRCRSGQPRHFDLRKLVTQHLGLKGVGPDGKPLPPSRLRKAIRTALAQLEKIGFIEPAPESVRFGPVRGRDQRITIVRGEINKPKAPTDNPLVAEMVELGLWEETARQYVADPKYTDEFLQERVELLHWKMRTEGEVTPNDPGRYLRAVIEKPMPLPANFQTRQQQKAKSDKKDAGKIKLAKMWQAVEHLTKQEVAVIVTDIERLTTKMRGADNMLSQRLERHIMKILPQDIRQAAIKWEREGKILSGKLYAVEYLKAIKQALSEAQIETN